MMDCLSEGKKTSFEYVWLVDKLYLSLFLMWLIRVTDRGERERIYTYMMDHQSLFEDVSLYSLDRILSKDGYSSHY